MAHNHHLPLRVDKCVALWPLQDQDNFRTLLNNTDVGAEEGCMTLLGTAVGNVPAKISEWVRDKVESWAPPLRDLQSPVVPAQVALLLARTYATAKPNFLTRSLPPIYTKEPLHRHYEEVLSAVASNSTSTSRLPVWRRCFGCRSRGEEQGSPARLLSPTMALSLRWPPPSPTLPPRASAMPTSPRSDKAMV